MSEEARLHRGDRMTASDSSICYSGLSQVLIYQTFHNDIGLGIDGLGQLFRMNTKTNAWCMSEYLQRMPSILRQLTCKRCAELQSHTQLGLSADREMNRLRERCPGVPLGMWVALWQFLRLQCIQRVEVSSGGI